MADETSFCSNPDCKHATIGHFAKGCMMPGCKCPRTYGNEENAPGTESTPASPPAAGTSSAAPAGMVAIPPDCIVSPCKVSAGRFVLVIVPLRLSKAEAQRLISFILSQADDSEPPVVPPTESAATVATKVEGNV